MILLNINNSYCRLENLSKQQLSELKKILSVKTETYGVFSVKLSNSKQRYAKDYRGIPRLVFRSYDKTMIKGYGLQRKPLISSRGNFPTGLLYLVENWLAGLTYTRQDLRIRPQMTLNSDLTLSEGVTRIKPYIEQIEASEAFIREGAGRGIISAPTGVGKTLIAALIIDKLKLPTLVVVPRLGIKSQTISCLESWFGKDQVGPDKLITIENVDSLDVTKIVTNKHLLIIDEFHHSAAETYQKLNKTAWQNIYYRAGLTATPFRADDSERLLLEAVLSNIVYRIPEKTAVEKKYIVPVEAFYVELPKIELKGDKSDWQSVYKELVVNRKDRNKLIVELLKGLILENKKTLALVKEIEHGEELSKLVGLDYFANGEDSDRAKKLIEDFNKEHKPMLIGTNGILGEGVDTKPAEYIIIAGLGKSKVQFMQQIGRGRRLYTGKQSCKVILFKDASHKWTLDHFNEQVKVLKEEYGVTPKHLPFPSVWDLS